MVTGNNESISGFNESGVPNALFATEPEFDIPWLDINLCADFIDLPLEPWGAKARTKKHKGTVHFYVQDYRFTGTWKKPNKIIDCGCVTIIEPNFSVSLSTPRALVLERIYKKRWLARYWQEHGIKVVVDMNVPSQFHEYNLLGVPRDWFAFATHGYNDRIEGLNDEYNSVCHHRGDEDFVWLVYGGGEAVKKYCQDRKWLWFPEQSDMTRGRIKPDTRSSVYTQTRTREGVQQSVSV